MRLERFANAASTTLAATITSTDTMISVADGSAFPSEGNFRLLVDSEWVLATARSGNTLTVERAIEGSTAADHVSGVTVAQILTLGGIQQYARDNVPGF